MNLRRQAILACAITGLVLTVGLFAYLRLTADGHIRSDAIFFLSLIICPPSILTVAFIDVQPSKTAEIIMFSVVALLNALLYGAIGAFILKFLWKST